MVLKHRPCHPSLFRPSLWPICLFQTLPPLPRPPPPAYWPLLFTAIERSGVGVGGGGRQEGSGQLFPSVCVRASGQCGNVCEKNFQTKPAWGSECVCQPGRTHQRVAGHVGWTFRSSNAVFLVSFFIFYYFDFISQCCLKKRSWGCSRWNTGVFGLSKDLVQHRDYAAAVRDSQPWKLHSETSVWWVLKLCLLQALNLVLCLP